MSSEEEEASNWKWTSFGVALVANSSFEQFSWFRERFFRVLLQSMEENIVRKYVSVLVVERVKLWEDEKAE